MSASTSFNAGASGLGSLPLPPGSDSLRALIASKEQELAAINEYRVNTLESMLAEKEREIEALKAKNTKLKDDFAYNLKLFEERDAELDKYDTQVAEMTAAMQRKDAEIAELRSQAAEARARADAEHSRVVDLESFYTEQLRALRESIEAARRSREEESRKWRADVDALRAEADARQRAREAEWDATRRELTEAADAAVAAMQREGKRREDEYSTIIKEANERASAAQRAADDARREIGSLSAALDATRSALRTAETDAAESRAALEMQRVDLESRISGLQRERDAAVSEKQSLLEQYEARMSELLGSLRQVEAAFQAQRDDYEQRLSAVQNDSASAAREYTTVMEARLQSLVVKLTESEAALQNAQTAAAEATARAQSAVSRAEQAEQRLSALEHDATTARAEASSTTVRYSSQVTTLQARVQELQSAADKTATELAAARADATAASRRADDAEAEVRQLNATFDQRWASRESSLRSAQEEQLRALTNQRDSLARQLQAVAGTSTAAATALGLPSFALGAGAVSSADARAASVLDQLSNMEQELQASRAETARLRDELMRARAGAVHTTAQAGKLSTSLSSQFTGDMGAASPMLAWPGAGDLSLASGKLMPTATGPPAVAGRADGSDASQRIAELEDQNARLRAVVADMRVHMEGLQAQATEAQAALTAVNESRMLRPLEADAGEAARRLAESEARRVSAESLLTGVVAERDALSAEVSRMHEYINMLQARLDALAGGRASSGLDDAAECRLLRAHMKTLSDSAAALRSALRHTQHELAQAKAQQSYTATLAGRGGDESQRPSQRGSATSQQLLNATANTEASFRDRDGASNDAHRARGMGREQTQRGISIQPPSSGESVEAFNEDLEAARTDIQRLLEEREKLLELSNQLRGDLQKALSRQQGTSAPSARGGFVSRAVVHGSSAQVEALPQSPVHADSHPRRSRRGSNSAGSITGDLTSPVSAPPDLHAESSAGNRDHHGRRASVVDDARIGYLESALVALSEQNAQLQRDMRRLAAQATQSFDHAATRGRNEARSPEVPAVRGVSAPSHGRRLSDPGSPPLALVSMPAPPPQVPGRSRSSGRAGIVSAASGRYSDATGFSPSRGRLDAEKSRLGVSREGGARASSRGNPWSTVDPSESVVTSAAGDVHLRGRDSSASLDSFATGLRPDARTGGVDVHGSAARLNTRYAGVSVSGLRSSTTSAAAARLATAGARMRQATSPGVMARTPPRRRSHGGGAASPTPGPTMRSPSEAAATTASTSASIGAAAAVVARVKAQQAAGVTSRVRNYNDLRA